MVKIRNKSYSLYASTAFEQIMTPLVFFSSAGSFFNGLDSFFGAFGAVYVREELPCRGFLMEPNREAKLELKIILKNV